MVTMRNLAVFALLLPCADALVPLIDGGKQMPKLYNGWMNEQIAKQASTGISNALAAGYDRIEVQFPPVPNLDEVRIILKPATADLFVFVPNLCTLHLLFLHRLSSARPSTNSLELVWLVKTWKCRVDTSQEVICPGSWWLSPMFTGPRKLLQP